MRGRGIGHEEVMEISPVRDHPERNSAQIWCCIRLNGPRCAREAHGCLIGCRRLEDSYLQVLGYILQDAQLRVSNASEVGNAGVYLRMKRTPDERVTLTLLDLRLHALDLVSERSKLLGFRLWTSPGVDFLP